MEDRYPEFWKPMQIFRPGQSHQTANTPQYDRQLYGAEGSISVTATWGFDFGLRRPVQQFQPPKPHRLLYR